MTQRQALLKAAERIDKGRERFSCIAVLHTGGIHLKNMYSVLASPRQKTPEALQIDDIVDKFPEALLDVDDIMRVAHMHNDSQEARAFRVLLLLVMWAAWKDLREIP